MAYRRTTTTTSSRRRAPRRRYRRRPARRRRTYRRRRAMPRQRKIKLTRYALGQIDPFDDRVLGAKIPDANTTPSSTVVANDEVTFTTDAVFGVAAKAFRPWLVNNFVTATAASANTWTWTAAYGGGSSSARQSSISTNYSFVRPVAHGVRLSCPVAPTTVTGFCHVALYATPTFSQSTWAFPPSVTTMNNCVWYKRYPLAALTQRTLTIVNKITDTSATFYRDPASDAVASSSDITFQSDGFCDIIIAVEAAGLSQAALSAESIIHFEALPLSTGVITPSPAADFNPAELSNVSRVSSVTDAVMFDGEQDRRMAGAVNAIIEGAGAAMGEVAGMIGTGIQNAAYHTGYAAARGAAGYAASLFNPGIPGVTNLRLLEY